VGWFEWDKLYTQLDDITDALSQQLDRIENKITRMMEANMAQAEQINASLDDLNAKTDEAAARLREILGSITPGMTQEQVDAITARIDAEASKLSGWGVNPDDPLPVPAT
jgi:methyl-accepting chemotaxis protein